MESYEQGYDVDRFENDVSQNFHCPICLNVFKDPVMCERNQHLFCRPCITRHLGNSQTCPSCKEELTLETLNQAPRIVRGCLSELNIRCDYFNRGCRELVQLGNLESHVKDCGFTPVVCSNEGCLVEINKRDRLHHETEVCDFRKVQCHNCAELNKEMDKVKTKLTVVHNEMGELKISLKAVNDKLDGMEDIKNSLTEIKEQLGQLGHLATLTDQIRSMQTVQEKMVKEIEGIKVDGTNVKHSVVLPGGDIPGQGIFLTRTNSVETFNCFKNSWTPLQSMKECRDQASAVIYKDQIIVSGGIIIGHGRTDSMESLAINPTMNSAQWSHFPAKLPGKLNRHNSVVYNGQLIVIGCESKFSDSIHGVSLDPPYTNKLLTGMPEPRRDHGAELFNDKILVVGGRKSYRP